MCNVVRISH